MLVLGIATAAASGFFHADDIAERSVQFGRASEASGTSYAEVSARSELLAQALRSYEEALDFLGDRAPDPERARQIALTNQFHAEHQAIEAFANTLMVNFDGAFQLALDRALVASGATDAVECAKQVPVGRQLPGMRTRVQDNPSCIGEDLNPVLAAEMDADPALVEAIDAITSRSWPAFTLKLTPMPIVGPPSTWISVSHFGNETVGSSLRELTTADEIARTEILAALERGEKASKWTDEGRAITEQTRERRAALGAPLLTAVDAIMAKRAKRKLQTAGWCANPVALGGCMGIDATKGLLPELVHDKKVLRALPD